MKFIQDDTRAREYAESSLGIVLCPPFVGLLLLDDNEAVKGVVIVNGYTKRNANVTVCSEGSWALGAARDLARYLFVKLGCARITAVTKSTNVKAIRACEALGFKREGIMRDHFDDCDGILLGLLKSEQKLLRL